MQNRLLELRNLEALKWTGLGCMLIDHVNLFLFDSRFPWAEDFGAVAFPLFGVALAGGMARSSGSAWAVVVRMLLWAVLAQVAWLTLRDGWMPNVLFTLAAGLCCDALTREKGLGGWRWLAIAVLLAVSVPFAFSVLGVVFVWCVAAGFRDRSYPAVIAAGGLLPLLAMFNSGSQAAVLSVGVVLLVGLLPRDLPRLRGFFYRAYAGHLMLLGFIVGLRDGIFIV